MQFIVFDIEATSLDVDTAEVHCVVLQVPGEAATSFRPGEIARGVSALNAKLEQGYTLVGHNIIEYDIPVLRRYGLRFPGAVYDTRVVSRAAYPGGTLYAKDDKLKADKPELVPLMDPKAPHSLGNWGLRLGCPKDNYEGGFEQFSEEMLRYCVQDVATNVVLFELLRERIPDEAALLECEVARICRGMRLHGVAFDRERAEELTCKLVARREELTKELRGVFGTWYIHDGERTPKRNVESKKYQPGEAGYRNERAGCSLTKIKQVEFNPASTDHIAFCLQKDKKWKPRLYTPNGKPKVTSEVLRDLPWPEAQLLAEYQEIKKVLGYLYEGDNAWLKLETKGRLHGTVHPTGTVTSRAAHSRPNTGNVPSRTELGHKCRELFVASPGKVIVGADAAGLQLRGLGHYIAPWDGGALARQCEGGDIHEYMRHGTKLYTRDRQKTWTYAMLFGAGPPKLGQIAIQDHQLALDRGLIDTPLPKQTRAKALGDETLANLGNAIPAFPKLQKELKKAASRGELYALDGRFLPIGSDHLAISVLLQSFEACVMKVAMWLAEAELRRLRAHYVLWVHDEFQTECRPEAADAVGRVLVDSMRDAGRTFGLNVKIDGTYHVGKTWADTH